MKSDIADIQARIRQFREERDWMQFHSPKNLACSISIEAAELLEHFQWANPQAGDQAILDKKEAIAHEIADILVYTLELADNLGIDPKAAILAKLELNAQKYPVAKARGSIKKYTEL